MTVAGEKASPFIKECLGCFVIIFDVHMILLELVWAAISHHEK
jgi:hypothetical protein